MKKVILGAAVLFLWVNAPSAQAGELLVGDYAGSILHYDGTTGAFLESTPGEPYLQGFAFGPNGNLYIANESGNNTSQSYVGMHSSVDGSLLQNIGQGNLVAAHQIAFGPDGNLYVVSTGSNDIVRFDGTTGAFMNNFVSNPGANSVLSLEYDRQNAHWLVGYDVPDKIEQYDQSGNDLVIISKHRF